MEHGRVMDRIYRVQRHFYDATRWMFLAGRDRLIEKINVGSESYVLEVGCGTARNLLVLAKKKMGGTLFGVDVSEMMLETARGKIRRSGVENIKVVKAAGEEVDYRRTFGLERGFDVVFFSYSLSMIADWRRAMETAMGNVRDGGELLVVDFWDQKGWPEWVRWGLVRWLRIFHVRFEAGMMEYLEEVGRSGEWVVEVESILGRYAFLARLKKK